MATALFYHKQFLEHETGLLHPENPERLQAILHGLKPVWNDLVHVTPEPATEEQILLAHTRRHFEFIRECGMKAPVQIDMDTLVSKGSFGAAMLAAGAAVQAVRGIMEGQYRNAFAAVRPPGHHATPDRAMGFCLFNNIAIAARYLIQEYGLQHVLIVDWDVHHGNGTQDIFYNDPFVIYLSLHKKHHYPGTGWEHEHGGPAAPNTKINYPMGAPFEPPHYLDTFHVALEEAAPFQPEFILISCGFDAHERDPLGNLGLTSETYGTLTTIVKTFARKFGHERIFSILEGGYDYQALAESALIHAKMLLEE